MAKEKWFVIIDSCLKNYVGHYYEYDTSIAEAAIQQGFKVCILAHRDFKLNLSGEIEIKPVFRTDIWSTNLSKLKQNWDFYKDLHKGISSIPLNKHSYVLMHSFIDRQFLAGAFNVVSSWFLRKKPGYIFLMHYQPLHYQSQVSQKAFRILEKMSKRVSIQMATDSEGLAREYQWLTELPFTVFPIPHTKFNNPESSETRKVKIVSLGNARDEKGILEIMDAVRIINKTQFADQIDFVLQCNNPQTKLVKPISIFKNENHHNVQLIENSLSMQGYHELLTGADVILLPYWVSTYRLRTSGIFAEALAAGKPVIVSNHTWMSAELKKFSTGEICKDSNPDDLAKVIVKVAGNYELYRQKAISCVKHWTGFHNAENFIRLIINPPIQINKNFPPKKIAVIRQLNKHRYDRRSTLLIDYLRTRVEEVRVLQCGSSVDNVNYEIYESGQSLYFRILELARFADIVFFDSSENEALVKQACQKGGAQAFDIHAIPNLVNIQLKSLYFSNALEILNKVYNLKVTGNTCLVLSDNFDNQKIREQMSLNESFNIINLDTNLLQTLDYPAILLLIKTADLILISSQQKQFANWNLEALVFGKKVQDIDGLLSAEIDFCDNHHYETYFNKLLPAQIGTQNILKNDQMLSSMVMSDVNLIKITLAKQALEKHQFQIALQILQIFLEEFPEHSEANLLMCETQLALGESIAGVTKYTQIAATEFSGFDILLREIRLLIAIGQAKRVELELNQTIFKKLAELSGENLTRFVGLIWELFAKKEYAVIADWCRLLVEKFPDQNHLHYLYALILHYGHIDLELAFKHYTCALDLGIDQEAIEVNRAELLKLMS